MVDGWAGGSLAHRPKNLSLFSGQWPSQLGVSRCSLIAITIITKHTFNNYYRGVEHYFESIELVAQTGQRQAQLQCYGLGKQWLFIGYSAFFCDFTQFYGTINSTQNID